MFDPVDKDSVQKESIVLSKRKWRTSQGFAFPGFKSSFESNMPRLMVDEARLAELREVTMSFKFLHPSLPCFNLCRTVAFYPYNKCPVNIILNAPI